MHWVVSSPQLLFWMTYLPPCTWVEPNFSQITAAWAVPWAITTMATIEARAAMLAKAVRNARRRLMGNPYVGRSAGVWEWERSQRTVEAPAEAAKHSFRTSPGMRCGLGKPDP